MKWVIIKGVRYPSSVISAFAAYNMDNPFLKVRIRNKYHIVPFDDVNKMANQMVYLMDTYPLPCPLDWREGRKLDLIKKMNT